MPLTTSKKKQNISLARRLRRNAPAILVLTLITLLLDHFNLLDRFSNGSLDFFQTIQKPLFEDKIRVIEITQKDYARFKKSGGGLDAQKILDLLIKISSGRPLLIAVDLNTSAVPDNIKKKARVIENVIWACNATIEDPPAPKHSISSVEKNLDILFKKQKIYKLKDGWDKEMVGAGKMGIARLPIVDNDGKVRKVRRFYKGENGKQIESFHWAITRTICGNKDNKVHFRGCRNFDDKKNSTQESYFKYLGDSRTLHTISASAIQDSQEGEEWRKNGPLTNRIVFLGATYKEAYDTHETPLESTEGVKIWAKALQSELTGGSLYQPPKALLILVDILCGVFCICIYHWLPNRLGILTGFLCIFPLAAFSSLILFTSFAMWANFIPIGAGVLFHDIYHHSPSDE